MSSWDRPALDIGDFCDGAAHRVNRARLAEIIEAVPARAFEADLGAPAAAGLIDDAVNAHLVDRDETIDVGVVAEQRFGRRAGRQALPRRRCRRT